MRILLQVSIIHMHMHNGAVYRKCKQSHLYLPCDIQNDLLPSKEVISTNIIVLINLIANIFIGATTYCRTKLNFVISYIYVHFVYRMCSIASRIFSITDVYNLKRQPFVY